MYLIRNDSTGSVWSANSGEARLYAIGGELDGGHSVFRQGGSPIPLSIHDI